MNSRAKFRCVQVRKTVSTGGWGNPPGQHDADYVEFQAVQGPENVFWSKWTPSGMLQMTITNPDLFDSFVAGKDYYLDISPVEE